MPNRLHQLHPAHRSDHAPEAPGPDRQTFIYVLGGNLVVPVVASHTFDHAGSLAPWAGFAILLCFVSLLLQGLVLIVERLRRSALRDLDRITDVELHSRLSDKAARHGAVASFSTLVAVGLLLTVFGIRRDSARADHLHPAVLDAAARAGPRVS